jgi:sensor histidine kinase YesM
MWRGMTWRRIALTQSVAALAVLVVSFKNSLLGAWMGHPSLNYAAMSVSAFSILAMMLYADELVNRGAWVRLVYPLTILLVFPLTFLITGMTEEVYYAVLRIPQAAAEAHRWVFISRAEEIAVICVFGMVIFMNRRAAERMLERVQAAELKRVQLEGQLIESRLATAQAQVDPEMLFSALEEIRDGFNCSRPDADAKLDELVQHLRSALARSAAIDCDDAAGS